MPWTREIKSISCHYLFREKIIQNCLKIDSAHLYDNDLLLKLEIKKKSLHFLEANIITITKKDINLFLESNLWFPRCLKYT